MSQAPQLHDCHPTPLQREGLMRRAETYRAWVASGTVRRIDAEAMLQADARQIGCEVDMDDYLAVQPRPQAAGAARHKPGSSPDGQGHREKPVAAATTASVRKWH